MPCGELARLVERLRVRIRFRVADRRRGLGNLVLQFVEVVLDVLVERRDVRGLVAAAQHRLGVANLVADALVADPVGRLGQLARRVALVAEHVTGGGVELLLELLDLAGELRPCADRAAAPSPGARRPADRGLRDVLLDLLLLAGHRLGLAQRVLHVASGARRLRLLELALGLLQLLHRLRGRGGRVRVAVCRRLPHRIGGLLQLARGLLQLRAVLFARELLELPRGFFRLLGERALRVAAALTLALRGAPALPLGLLLLPARQLLQLLGELVDLLVGLLLRRALRRLVLVGHLVDFELEEIGELLGHLLAAATAAAALLLLVALTCSLVLFLGLLQELERAMLRRQRLLRDSPP